jgi:23S rRNA (adenine2503-C2)-methyltransferase
MTDLAAMTRPQLRDWLAGAGHATHADALWTWLFRRGGRDFSELGGHGRLPSALVRRLGEEAIVGRPGVVWEHTSGDGTVKWLVSFADGQRVEMVFIPDGRRGTLCVSSQVGCTLTCRFCHTGTQSLARNLTAGEIIGQVLLARDRIGDHELPADQPRRLTNIVFMGMGEPFYNYDAVAAAVRVLSDRDGLAISRRRITVSTSGVVPAIERCGRELGVNLAISLHAARDELRERIMPLNRRFPLAELMRACREYPGLSNNRRILFAYTLLDGVNDSDDDARDLVALLVELPAKVNLIPFNPWPGAPYEASPRARVRDFQEILLGSGLAATVRETRGDDIAAACGQLKTVASA